MGEHIAWYLIQYTADLRRREPRNIGVAAVRDRRSSVRMVAVDPMSGAVDGRALRRFGIYKDDYEPWVSYYSDMLAQNAIDRVQSSQRKRPTEFRLVVGGFSDTGVDVAAFTNRLYAELVDSESPTNSRDWAGELAARAESVFVAAGVSPIPTPVVTGRWGTVSDSIEFDYGFAGNRLLDRVQLHRKTLDSAKRVARDFNARVVAARDAGSARSFVALYSQSAVDDMGTDLVLAPLWQVAHTIDVDSPIDKVVTELRHALSAA